jgi:hypothetical protein
MAIFNSIHELLRRIGVADLEEKKPDIVLIGAGVRTDRDHYLLFERLINLVHEHAPQARLAFNTLPFDSVEAVERWA